MLHPSAAAMRGGVSLWRKMSSPMRIMADAMALRGNCCCVAPPAAVAQQQQQQQQQHPHVARRRFASSVARNVTAAAAVADGGNTSTTSSSSSHTAPAPPPNVRELATMAHIALSDAEVADFEPKIGGIVDWFGQLQAVDVAGVEPAVHVGNLAGAAALRADTVADYAARAQLLAAAPAMEGAFVRVPKIATGADGASSSSTSGSSVDDASATGADGAASSATATGATTTASPEETAALDALDIRVGRIVSCERHPDADSLYVEQIECGDADGPRTIVSGLVKYVPLEAMQGRLVIVLANLKARNMRGIKSHGMLLAASNAEHTEVEPLAPPPNATPGERVYFGSGPPPADRPKPAEPNAVQKKKHWETAQPALATDGARVVTFRGAPMMTGAGPVTAETLAGARIG